MKYFAVFLILPAAAYSAIIFGGADTAKQCSEVLVNGTVKDTVPDPDNCSQYFVCSNWFQSKMKCKTGKHFSATEKKCVDPCAAACDTTLICTTTSEPEISTETAAPSTTDASAPAKSSDADISLPTENGDKGSEATESGSAENNATDASAKATDAPATMTNAPDAEPKIAVEETTIALEESTNAADESTIGAEETTRATDAASSENDTGRTSDKSAETSTAFWQTIAKHFNQPPSTIPDLAGSEAE